MQNTALAHTSGAVGALLVDACSRRPPISFSRKVFIKSCHVKPYDSMAGMQYSSRAVHNLLRLSYAVRVELWQGRVNVPSLGG